MGTATSMTFFYTARWKRPKHTSLSLSHGAQPQSHATTNTSCKFSTVSRHESEERSERISVSLKLPSLPQPRRRQRIITVNIVTQVSFSPFFGPVSQYVEQQMFHLWLASRRRVPVFEHLVLYSIYYSPVGSYRARQRGSLLSWTDGPLLQVAGSSTETEAAIGIEVYIYRTSGCAPSPCPPICLCGFTKGPDGLSEIGLLCCNKIRSLNPEVWQSLCILCCLPLQNNVE